MRTGFAGQACAWAAHDSTTPSRAKSVRARNMGCNLRRRSRMVACPPAGAAALRYFMPRRKLFCAADVLAHDLVVRVARRDEGNELPPLEDLLPCLGLRPVDDRLLQG